MASLFIRTYTFTDGTTAYGSQVESEIANLVTVLNSLNIASTNWGQVSILNATSVPLVADCSSGTQDIADFKNNSVTKASISSTGILTLVPTTNQIVLGTTRTATLSAVTPASTSRVYTFPDAGGNANIVMDKGNYTISGTWTSPTFVTPVLGAATATSVNFGGTSLSVYAEGTWTPTDGSGVALSLTVSSAKYTKIGNVVHIEAFLSYPVTASGTASQINGLPFTVSGYATARIYSNSGVGYYMRFNDGTTNASIYNAATNAAATNANLSSSQVMFSGIYLV